MKPIRIDSSFVASVVAGTPETNEKPKFSSMALSKLDTTGDHER